MKNCIFITFDDRYFIYAKVCLNSFDKNFPNHPPIKVLYLGNDPSVPDFLSKLNNVSILDYQLDISQFQPLNSGSIGSPMIFVRFILWTNFFDEYDNVIYVDCDTIILNPFPEVFESEDFFGVIDNSNIVDNSPYGVFSPDMMNDENLLTLLKKDNMEFASINNLMINSGFFVLPKKYRTKEHLNQIWQITNTYNKYIMWGDQSILSMWCYLNSIKISNEYKYNFQTNFIFTKAIQETSLDSIKIMHFAGLKPTSATFHDYILAANYVMKAIQEFERLSRYQSN